MNKVELIGILGADPELKKTGNENFVCNMRIAVDRKYKDDSGEKPTDWINITVWRKLAEICAKHLKKGKMIGVVGSLQAHSYEDKNGVKHNTYVVVADEIDFLSPKDSGENDGEYA